MTIDMKYRRTSSEQNPKPVWDKVDRYAAEFQGKVGAVNYRESTDLNLKIEEALKEYFAKVHDYACADMLRFAVEEALEIL